MGTTASKGFLKKNTMLFALVAVMVFFQILIVTSNKGSLFAPQNITNIISQNGYVIVLACGMLLCILTGGNIDLSVGSVVALVGAIAGTLIVNLHWNVYLSIAVCLAAGLAIGAWQGFWIAHVRIPAFIVTLAGMLLFRGLALIVLDGLTISPFPDNFQVLFTSFVPENGQNIMLTTMIVGAVVCLILIIMQNRARQQRIKKGYETEGRGPFAWKLIVFCAVIMVIMYLLGQNKGIPVVLILIVAIVLIYSYYTSKTVPGRYLYAMGGNEKAAKLSGINTNKVLFGAYVNMSFLAAVAALMCVARFNSATPSAGDGYELDAIGACFIGGASAYGGTGTIGGAVIGALFVGILNNGMSIMGVDSNWQKAVKGLVLLAAVVIDVMSKQRAVTAKKVKAY